MSNQNRPASVVDNIAVIVLCLLAVMVGLGSVMGFQSYQAARLRAEAERAQKAAAAQAIQNIVKAKVSDEETQDDRNSLSSPTNP